MARYFKHITFNNKFNPQFEFIWNKEEKFIDISRGRALDALTSPSILDIPNRAKLVTRHKTLTNILSVNNCMAISTKIKKIIEMVEPGVHQYFPIELSWSGGVEVYYLINICNFIDSIIVDKSSILINKYRDGSVSYRDDITHADYKALDASQVSGLHLWREKKFRLYTFVSDLLYKQLFEIGLPEIDFWYLAEEF